MTEPSERSEVDALLDTLGLDPETKPLSANVTLGADDLRPTRQLLGGPRLSREVVAVRASQRPPTLDEPLPKISLALGDASPKQTSTVNAARDPDLVVRALLGEGGMGAVHLARQRSLRRDVAVKRVKNGPNRTTAVDSLLREAWTTGALEHPNIVPIHALGVDDDGGPVLVMKRIEGTSWRELLTRGDHPAWKKLDEQHPERRDAHLEILMQVCNALHFAHSRGVSHRDLKPDNVMIGEYGEVYLLDWGIALRKDVPRDPLDVGVQLVGTPYYMAPEMVSGLSELIDARTDVYLLGALLHEVLTGKYRHDGNTLRDVLLSAALSDPYVYDPSVPADLAALCNQATHRDPAQRPSSAAAFRQAVGEYLRHRGSVALAKTALATFEQLMSLPGVKRLEPEALRSSDAARLMSECRFGYLQALREWEANDDARTGLDELLRVMIERELVQRNSDAAFALMREMRSAPAELATRVQALDEEISAQRARAEELKKAAKQMDSSVSSLSRIVVLVVSLGISALLAADSLRGELRSGRPTPMNEVMVIDAITMLVLVACVFFARKTLFANRISRRLTWLSTVAIALSFVSDGLTWLNRGSSRVAGFHAMMLLAACMSMGAVVLLPSLWFAAIILLAAAVTSAAYPVLTAAAVPLGTMLTLIIVVAITLRHARRGEHLPADL